MASGSQNMTTFNARQILGSNTAQNPGGALLQSGAGRADNSTTGDTWIFLDTLGGTSSYWGFKHSQGDNSIKFYGGGALRSSIWLGESKITATTFDGKATSAGAADTATKFSSARTIKLTGAVTGSVSADGSSGWEIATTVNHNHDSTYLKLSGGTMTGALTLKGEQYSGNYGMNANNSDIVGINSLRFSDTADSYGEGLMFKNGSNWDCFAAAGGNFYFRGATDGSPALSLANSNGNLYANTLNLNSNITFTATGTTGTAGGIYWSGSTDGAQLYYTVPSSDAGILVINMTDDANARLSLRTQGTERFAITSGGISAASSLTFSDANIGVRRVGRSVNWVDGRDSAVVSTTSLSGYGCLASIKTKNGSWDIGAYDHSSYYDDLLFSYCTDTDHASATYNNRTTAQIKFLENGHIVAALDGNASTATSAGSCTGNAATATALQTSRKIWGQSFDGTANVDGNFNMTTGDQFNMIGESWDGFAINYYSHSSKTNGQSIRFYNGKQTEIVRFCANGAVGIGTTSNSYKLYVSGTERVDDQLLVSNADANRGEAYSGAIQLREYKYQTTSCTYNYYNAPGITFHWGGRWIYKLGLYENALYWGANKVVINTGSWGINVTGSSGSCTGNAATATKATQDSDGNAINSTYLKKSGGTMTGMITAAVGNSTGIKMGDTYITAINGNVIFQNNTALRFGAADWDWNKWAGLKYDATNKIVYLGIPDNSVFTANSAQTNGTLNLVNTRYLTMNGKDVFNINTAIDNTPFTTVLRLFHNENTQSSNEDFTATNSSWGITFERMWSNGTTTCSNAAGIYAVGSGSWRTGLVLRTKNGTSNTGSHDVNALWLSPIGNVTAGKGLGVANTDSTTGTGISLYGGAKTDRPEYGLFFGGTGTFGKYGDVQSDWATYFTMNTNNQRGWIFKTYNQTADGYMAGGISSRGVATFKGLTANSQYVVYPSGGLYATATGTITGALKITLPQFKTNTMMTFDVTIYTYEGANRNTVIYHIGGYEYGDSGWYDNSSRCYSEGIGNRINLKVRFGYDGSKACVTIGEVDTTWNYPQVMVSNILCGYSNYSVDKWGSGWSVSFVTTLPGTISGNRTSVNTQDINITGNAATSTNATNHIALTNNPHSVTKSQVGLGNVENTALSTWAGTNKITTVGTISSGTWQGTAIAASYIGNHSTDKLTSGTLGVARGGTGLNTIAIYSILYASAKDTLSALAPNTTTTKKFLRMTGANSAGTAPVWDTVTKTDVGLSNVENTALSTWGGTSNIKTVGTISSGTWQGTAIAASYIGNHSTDKLTSGTLGVARGGTGLSTIAIYSVLYASAKDTLTALAPNTTATKKFLRMTGTGSAGAVPAWDTVTKSDVGLSNVENTKLSTWAGSSNLTTCSQGTFGKAATYGVTDSTSASAISSSGTSLTTERDIYYGLPTINNAHTYTSSTTIYAPTGGGTAGNVLVAAGATSTPGWYAGLSLTGAAAASYVASFAGTTDSSSTTTGAVKIAGGLGVAGKIYANKVYNAVWNDYAEFRECDLLPPGACVQENDDGHMTAADRRCIPGCLIISDTYGYAQGETAKANTPVAVAGRVLAYTALPRYMYHAGMAVCSAPGGLIDAMTQKEIREHPDCIIGYVSEIPDYDYWGSGNVEVNGRIWIRVK